LENNPSEEVSQIKPNRVVCVLWWTSPGSAWSKTHCMIELVIWSIRMLLGFLYQELVIFKLINPLCRFIRSMALEAGHYKLYIYSLLVRTSNSTTFICFIACCFQSISCYSMILTQKSLLFKSSTWTTKSYIAFGPVLWAAYKSCLNQCLVIDEVTDETKIRYYIETLERQYTITHELLKTPEMENCTELVENIIYSSFFI
jgi:hypothetical protein